MSTTLDTLKAQARYLRTERELVATMEARVKIGVALERVESAIVAHIVARTEV